MKLLIITQVIDTEHPILGFFHRWVEEFAKNCEQIHVICLQEGKHSLPANVTVHSLGKEAGKSRVVYLYRFYKLIWQLRHEYDNVFVHMNQIYVILGAPFWRAWGKKVGLWYVHRQVTLLLKIATLFAHRIFSSSPESFLIKTEKVCFLGHGIDLKKFNIKAPLKKPGVFVVAHVGRITKIKNIDILIEAARNLSADDISYKFLLYGNSVTSDECRYQERILSMIKAYNLEDVVIFKGSVRNEDIVSVLQEADVTVNLTPTGGMDKAVIESAAAGTPVITSNEAFKDFLGAYTPVLQVGYRDSKELTKMIGHIRSLPVCDRRLMCDFLRARAGRFDVENLIPNILSLLQSSKNV